jgi:hypothetical protein
MRNRKIFIILLFFLVTVFLNDSCQASNTGVISLNIPSIINPGSKVSVPLNLNITSGALGGWLIDIVMDPNYITVQSGGDLMPGNVANALLASNNFCVAGSPPCDPPIGMQVARVAGATLRTDVVGNVTLNNIAFTGVATSGCGTVVKVIVRSMVDSNSAPAVEFFPATEGLSFIVQATGDCDVTAPAAPAGLNVL